MKNIFKRRFLGITMLLAFVLPLSIKVVAQDSTSYEVTMELKTIKNNDDSRTFNVKITGDGDESFPIQKGEIKFYNVLGETKIELGKTYTDIGGKASFTVPAETKYLKDKEGKMTFTAIFTGSEALPTAESTVSVKDLVITLKLEEVDSVKTINLTANFIDGEGKLVPLNEVEIPIYIQGMFSKLKVGDAFFEAGECAFEFPKDLKGDFEGNLTIFCMVTENEDFGDVEKHDQAKWGTHRTSQVVDKRELWTNGAPIWMIITLTIMLVGVWSHYAYGVIQLFFIRKEGKELERNQKV